jgi:hypothetical protein
MGGEVVESMWRGAIVKHQVKCPEGHAGHAIPHLLPRRLRLCLECPLPVSTAAWEKFQKRVREMGGEVLDAEWRGNRQKYSIKCSEGHVNQIWPIGLYEGRDICTWCTGMSPDLAWEKFKALVEQLGGVVVEEAWKGKDEPHACLCPEGHQCAPRPGHLRRGIGLCRMCAGKAWDVFYVVVDEISGALKFGITSGDPRPRLGVHARDGFDTVVRLIEGLPGDLAPRLERAVRAALRDAQEMPVRGREYFPARAMGLVLDVVDGWTTSPPPADEPEQLALDIAA